MDLRVVLCALFFSLVDFSPGPTVAAQEVPPEPPLRIRIGALLDSEEHRRFFLRSLTEAAGTWQPPLRTLEGRRILLNATAGLVHSNPIATALQVCERLMGEGEGDRLHALLILEPAGTTVTGPAPDQFQLAAAAVSYTMGFYRIPIIGLANRDSAFSDKNIHRSFLRTVPAYFQQADVWVKLVVELGWKNVMVLSSSSPNGRMLLARLQSQMEKEDKDIAIERVVEFEAGGGNLSREMRPIVEAQSRVFLVYADRAESDLLFQQAQLLGLTGAGHVWIVTEQALSSPYCPLGALGLTLQFSRNTQAHITDAVHLLLHALTAAYAEKTLAPAPTSCSDTAVPWTDGPFFWQTLLKQELIRGATGHVALDDVGDRRSADYQVVNIQSGRQPVVVGHAQTLPVNDVRLTLDRRKILWPGETREVPKGLIVPNHLKVLTLREAPFTTVEAGWMEGGLLNTSWCAERFHGLVGYSNRSLNATTESVTERMRIAGKEYFAYCCWGYSMDLLQKLAGELNFTYDLFISTHTPYIAADTKGRYTAASTAANIILGRNVSLPMGSATATPAAGDPPLSGILRDLIEEAGDMAVAALTITPEHAKFVEFSKPFKYLGITILEKKPPSSSTLNSFFQPFQEDLWVLVMVSLHVVAVSLYLLDRFSPFSRYRLTEDGETEDDALNLSSAMWFAWGVLLNSGIGEGTPRSFGGRVLGMVWAGFAMIMVASYTGTQPIHRCLKHEDNHFVCSQFGGVFGVGPPAVRSQRHQRCAAAQSDGKLRLRDGPRQRCGPVLPAAGGAGHHVPHHGEAQL
ncbi:glutamate [NMDA] receptor subunit 1-like isoform X1 [Paramacrobiotus metropolitanus]|uniref:glutamate [NMDA] receptor subunit 1-like isoform X1 n=1 Tax=Paramacrobiotus metropolitanus TaxID=2943436 RepID=UPI002445703F|nr:glutamate [NMDA] receptor subunit 1-like isoform X1 [Paramacrobiotus metropolitanus]